GESASLYPGWSRPALRYAERLVGHDSALRMLADRRADVYDTVVPLTPGALGRRRGDVLATLVDDVDALLDDRLRVRSPLIVLVGVGLLGAVFGVLLVPVTGLLVVALVGCTLLVAALVRWRVSGAEPEVVRQRSLLSARVLTALHGARDLVLWQATPGAEAGIDEAGQRLDAATRASASSVALGRALVTAAAGACVAAIALLVAPAVSASAVSMPMGVALLLLPVALLEVLATAPDAAAASVRTRAAMRRLVALAATAPAVTTPSDPLPPPSPRAGITATGLAGGWAQPAFAGLDLEVLPGHRVGVVGPSGSGKSTLAATLVRFLDPAAGRVAIDADDLLDLDLGDVRRHVGLVDDDPYVFSSSVLENVRLARPAATGAEVETAVRAVSLGPWLDALPDGLDTLVGEGQAGVSGGERARLGLARAVLADAPVLVLDEPTAHLDASTARAVAADVLRATEGRAVVWITHDDVALDAMDRVVDLTAYAQPG
ncbi:MAG: thiol reductant ABC exporter subunit CydC, partial [Nocardioidaceae bacterium]